MRAVLCAVIALAPLMLGGCNLLNKPTLVVLRRCVVIGKLPIGQPLSVLEKALTANGATAQWQKGKGRTYLLRITKTNQLNAKTANLAFEIDQADNGMTGADCGPGAAIITQASFNGEDMEAILTENLVINSIESFLGHKLGQPPANPTPPAAPAATILAPPQNSAAEDDADLNAEVAAEQEMYGDRAEQAKSRQIRVFDRGTYYCCLTIGRVYEDLRARGAEATIDTADDGRIWIDAKASTPLWLGQSELSLTFYPFGNGVAVELRTIKAGASQIAGSPSDSDISAASYLTDTFKLTKMTK